MRSVSWFSQNCVKTEINCTIHLWTCKLSKVMLLFSNYLFENKMVFSSEFNHIRNEYRNRNETITSQLRQEGNQMHFFRYHASSAKWCFHFIILIKCCLLFRIIPYKEWVKQQEHKIILLVLNMTMWFLCNLNWFKLSRTNASIQSKLRQTVTLVNSAHDHQQMKRP